LVEDEELEASAVGFVAAIDDDGELLIVFRVKTSSPVDGGYFHLIGNY
jgi:hypothetical protein